jgi:hypothetical protein
MSKAAVKFAIRVSAVVAVTLVLGPSNARGDSITPADMLDPLHGYCAPAATQCIDNGTNSPTSINAPSHFGFTVSPGPAAGDLLIDVLVPNNETASSFALTGTLSGTASEFSTTAWTSGSLAPYLGLAASPNNPIGAYLPSTQALDPAATGFFVYQVDLGTLTLQGPSSPNVFPLETISAGIPLASYIVGFLNEGTSLSPNWIATANSGAIFETSSPPVSITSSTVPEPGSLLLLGSGVVVALRKIRRRN